MYTIICIRFGPEIVVNFIANESQVSEIIDFVKQTDAPGIDIMEEIEVRFDARIQNIQYFDPFGWDEKNENN